MIFYLTAFLSFCLSILLAWHYQWKSIDLFWGLFLSSFIIGYLVILLCLLRRYILDRLNTGVIGKVSVVTDYFYSFLVFTLLYGFIYSFIGALGTEFFTLPSYLKKGYAPWDLLSDYGFFVLLSAVGDKNLQQVIKDMVDTCKAIFKYRSTNDFKYIRQRKAEFIGDKPILYFGGNIFKFICVLVLASLVVRMQISDTYSYIVILFCFFFMPSIWEKWFRKDSKGTWRRLKSSSNR